MKKCFAILAAVVGCTGVQAQESNWKWVAGAGWANGGGEITSGLIIERGTNREIPFDIKAGGGLQLRFGGEFKLFDRVALQGTIGRSVTDPMGDNGSLTFTTTPAELMGFVQISEGLRIGAGVRKTHARCRVPCDYVPRRSWPLFKARAVLVGLLAALDLENKP